MVLISANKIREVVLGVKRNNFSLEPGGKTFTRIFANVINKVKDNVIKFEQIYPDVRKM